MSVPTSLLRSLRHPANPENTVFDDLEVEFLASVFVKYRSVYEVQPKAVATALTKVVQELHDDHTADESMRTSYNLEKNFYSQECLPVRQSDTEALLHHFSRKHPSILRPWSELLKPKISHDILGKAGAFGDFIRVSPIIHQCLFCDHVLEETILSAIGGDRSIGGRSWAYCLDTGACVALVGQRKCHLCGTIYNLQTYTPGPSILTDIGKTL